MLQNARARTCRRARLHRISALSRRHTWRTRENSQKVTAGPGSARRQRRALPARPLSTAVWSASIRSAGQTSNVYALNTAAYQRNSEASRRDPQVGPCPEQLMSRARGPSKRLDVATPPPCGLLFPVTGADNSEGQAASAFLLAEDSDEAEGRYQDVCSHQSRP